MFPLLIHGQKASFPSIIADFIIHSADAYQLNCHFFVATSIKKSKISSMIPRNFRNSIISIQHTEELRWQLIPLYYSHIESPVCNLNLILWKIFTSIST